MYVVLTFIDHGSPMSKEAPVSSGTFLSVLEEDPKPRTAERNVRARCWSSTLGDVTLRIRLLVAVKEVTGESLRTSPSAHMIAVSDTMRRCENMESLVKHTARSMVYSQYLLIGFWNGSSEDITSMLYADERAMSYTRYSFVRSRRSWHRERQDTTWRIQLVAVVVNFQPEGVSLFLTIVR